MAHGPTMAIAAFLSAKLSPLYFSFGARLSLYSVAQKFATSRPAGESKVGLPFSTSCLPPDSAMNSG